MAKEVAMTSVTEPQAEFPLKHYVVTPGCLCCLVLCPQTLDLEPEEVVYKVSSPCDTKVKRMPYGQLGSVDKATACGCCIGNIHPAACCYCVLCILKLALCHCRVAVDSNLTPGGEETIQPGCGCQTALVEEIVAELKARCIS